MNLKRVKLGDLSVNITDGEHGSVVDDPCGEYFLLSNKNIQNGNVVFNESDRKINKQSYEKINKRTKLENGDVVISTVGTIGRTSIIENATLNYDFQRSVGIIKTNQHRLNNRYLHYYFQLPYVQKRLQYLSKGAIQKCLFISDLKDIDIDIPENLDDQKRIGDFLGIIDSKIKLNNRINTELESMAKLIYDYWFVQFDFPDENGKPYKSSGGKMVYNDELKREIPEHWNVKALHNFASTASGGTPLRSKKEYYENGKIVWINSGEVNQPFIIRGSKYITEMGLKNSSAKVFERGTILMAMYGATAGKVSLMDLKAATNQAICGINPINSYYTYFTKFALQDLYEHLVTLSSGSARDNLSQEKIRNLKFPFPKDQILISYHKRMKPIFDLILNNLKENDQLIEVRDWLLPMLMNGQVTIKD